MPTYLVFDGHNDTLLNLRRPEGQGRSFFERHDVGHIDLPRAREGGFAGGFFAVFIEDEHTPDFDPDSTFELPEELPPALEHRYALQVATVMTAELFRLEAESEGELRVVRTAGELEACLSDGVLAAVLHFEGAEAIDTDFKSLEVFYRAGLRSLGPVWSRPTAFGTGVPFKFPASPDIGPGLTDAGKALVKACNELGVMIDLSHLNEKGFWDVASLTDKPLVATHSAVHALCASPRNLTDKQFDAIRESGGMVGLNFGVGFLREDGDWNADATLADMVRHLDYMIDRMGIDHVGLGSDYDGARISTEIKDVAGLPNLIAALQAAGYDDDALNKLTHRNWVRVLRETWGE